MKQNILLIIIALTMLTATAQEATYSLPKHKWDIGADISSPEDYTEADPSGTGGVSAINKKDKTAFSVGLFGNYYLRNNVFIRLRARICDRIVNHHEDNLLNIDTVFHYTYVRDETIRQSSKTIAVSIGKNIVEQKFIRAYVGLEMAATFFGKYTSDNTDNENNLSGIYSFIETKNYIVPGGYALRLGPFVGCQLIFLKNFSVGPEISYAFQYYKAGGDSSLHDVAVNSSTNTYFSNFDTTVHNSDTNEGMGFSHIKVAFNIVYSF